MPERVRWSISEFPGKPGGTQHDSRRNGGGIQEYNKQTSRGSFLDDVDIAVDESMDHADAFNGGETEALGRRPANTLHRADPPNVF